MSDRSPFPGGRGSSTGGGRTAAFSAARGALLVGLAVIIGIVLLQVIDDGTTGPIGDGGTSSNGTSATTAPGGGGTTSTTAATPEKTPAEVAVLVLNGSGRAGAARAMTDSLKAKGYQTLTPADAEGRSGTVVYFRPDLERECTTVATAVGGNPTVEPMPDPAPAGSENAGCVVILGA